MPGCCCASLASPASPEAFGPPPLDQGHRLLTSPCAVAWLIAGRARSRRGAARLRGVKCGCIGRWDHSQPACSSHCLLALFCARVVFYHRPVSPSTPVSASSLCLPQACQPACPAWSFLTPLSTSGHRALLAVTHARRTAVAAAAATQLEATRRPRTPARTRPSGGRASARLSPPPMRARGK